MERIITGGITYLEPLNGSGGWYWGSDYAQGDLYEAEELYRQQHEVNCNRLVFVHYPDGYVAEPVQGRAGQYFGNPLFYDGKIQILLVDFLKSLISILQYDGEADRSGAAGAVLTPVVSMPLGEIKDCYNLMLHRDPLMLTRQGGDGQFQILWPEKAQFPIYDNESFVGRKDDILYFSRWYESPAEDYREEIVFKHYPDGAIVEVVSGSWNEMPDGRIWLLE